MGNNTSIPLPQRRMTNIAGLITIQLPIGIKKGPKYTVVIQQYSGLKQRNVGSFQFTIVVKADVDVLPEVANMLSLMRYNASLISISDRWYPIMNRYITQLADSVRDFGTDPNEIKGAPYGTYPHESGTCQLHLFLSQNYRWLALLALVAIILGVIFKPV